MSRRLPTRAEIRARIAANAAAERHDRVLRAGASTRAGVDTARAPVPASLVAAFWAEQRELAGLDPATTPCPAASPVALPPPDATPASQVRTWARSVGIPVQPAGALPRAVRELYAEHNPSRADPEGAA